MTDKGSPPTPSLQTLLQLGLRIAASGVGFAADTLRVVQQTLEGASRPIGTGKPGDGDRLA